MCKSNSILVLTLVSISFNYVVSSYSLVATKTDLDNFVNNTDNLNVKAAPYSGLATCLPHREPDSLTSNCCGNRFVKKNDRKKRSVGKS